MRVLFSTSLFIVLIFSDFNEVYAQTDSQNKENILIECEIHPQFKGGGSELSKFIKNNLQYPQSAIEKEIEGRVIVRFMITKYGEITNISVAHGLDSECDKEAIRIVQIMPKWEPGGTICGQNAKNPDDMWYALPFNFRLADLDNSQKE